MLLRSWAGAALVLLGCGSSANDGPAEGTAGTSSMAGAAPTTAGSSTGGTVAQAGAGGAPTSAGVAGASGATGGQPGPTAGATAGGAGGAGGAATAGTGSGGTSAGAAGSAGKPATGGNGGSGGAAVDPLAPKPIPGCPGYVKVLVPHGTCVWFHGSFTSQSEQCDVANPSTRTCSTASAPGADTTAIVSDGALIDRFDFNESGCPKACQ